jgi:hypothetical protein
VIVPETGALLLAEGRVERGTTRAEVRGWPTAQAGRWHDMRTGWAHVDLPTQAAGDRAIGARLLFDGERLDGYRLWIVDARYGTSWDDWSEEKELAHRDAHDALLVELLGPGVREARPGGSELTYTLPWGDVWSTYDARSGGSTIGTRFRR